MSRTYLRLSLVLNCLLAVALAWAVSTRRSGRPQPGLPSPSQPLASEPPAAAAPFARPALVPGTMGTNFHWSQVESADYYAYIANLRAIGCPEETIRDIIVADVNKLFAPRYAALQKFAPELAWWGRFEPRKPVRSELAARIQALNEERKAILQRLLGGEGGDEVGVADFTVSALREQNTYAFLPEDKQTAVRDLMNRYQTLREWNEPRWQGLPTAEREALEKEWRDARAKDLAALLTPEEMGEFDLRHSPTADSLRQEYGKGNLTEAEFRSLYDLRRKFEQDHPDSTRDDWKELEADFASVLGPERLEDLQRQNDDMWRALESIASEGTLSGEAMAQAYAIKREYTEKLVQAVGQMFADPQQDPQPLRDLAKEMDGHLAEWLGPETVRQLDRLGVLPRLVIQDDGQRRTYSFSRGGFAE